MKTECCCHGIALVEVGPGCFPAMSSGVSRQACSVICYDLQKHVVVWQVLLVMRSSVVHVPSFRVFTSIGGVDEKLFMLLFGLLFAMLIYGASSLAPVADPCFQPH